MKMTDQATALRGLMQNRHAAVDKPRGQEAGRAVTIAVTSGKGGVGKSNIALNLGIALAQQNASVCLIDANFGLGNIDLLCGLNGYWNLSHVVTGARQLKDVVISGPCGIDVVPGASGLAEIADCPEAVQLDIISQLQELEESHDFLIIDTGTGIHRPVRQFVAASDRNLIITTPEPTAIADAYATVKALSSGGVSRFEVVVNRAASAEQAREILGRLRQTAWMFLKCDVDSAGFIPDDPAVSESVARRSPFIIEAPNCPAAKHIQKLAKQLGRLKDVDIGQLGFFTKFWQRLTAKKP